MPRSSGAASTDFDEYEEDGDFIDFFDPTSPIIPDAFVADGPRSGSTRRRFRYDLNRDFAIAAEGRYQWATTRWTTTSRRTRPGSRTRSTLRGDGHGGCTYGLKSRELRDPVPPAKKLVDLSVWEGPPESRVVREGPPERRSPARPAIMFP